MEELEKKLNDIKEDIEKLEYLDALRTKQLNLLSCLNKVNKEVI